MQLFSRKSRRLDSGKLNFVIRSTGECRQQKAGQSFETDAGCMLEWNWMGEKGQVIWEGLGQLLKITKHVCGVFLVSVHEVCGHVWGTQARGLDQSRNTALLENEVFHFDRFSKYLKQILLNV